MIQSPFYQLNNNKIKFESFAIGDTKTFVQKAISVFGKDNKGTQVSFPKMTIQEIETFKIYCPRLEFLSKTQTPIHEKALDIIEQTEGMFTAYQVWHEAEDQIDPILVGVNLRPIISDQNKDLYTKELLDGKNYFEQNDYYLLCRWGESLKPISEIKKIAFETNVNKTKITNQREIKRLQREIEDVDDNTRQLLGYYE